MTTQNETTENVNMILPSEVASLVKSKIVTNELLYKCVAAWLNSGKDRADKIASFKQGIWKERLVVVEDHCPELTALGFTHTKSKLKISGNHRITSVIDLPSMADVMPLVATVADYGFVLDSIEPSKTNVGMFSLFVKKEWSEQTEQAEQ